MPDVVKVKRLPVILKELRKKLGRQLTLQEIMMSAEKLRKPAILQKLASWPRGRDHT